MDAGPQAYGVSRLSEEDKVAVTSLLSGVGGPYSSRGWRPVH